MDQHFDIFGPADGPAPLPSGSNQRGMRAHNERLVLTLIRQTGAMAKAEIARRTGLSAQTVSVIIRSLEADGLLERGEPQRGRIGQPSVPISLAADGAFFFGLKIGRRSLDLVLTDFLGVVRHRLRETHAFPTPEACVRFARNGVATLRKKLPQPHRSRVAGLGIALPFQLWDWAETLGVDPALLDDWRHTDISREIGKNVDLTVLTCNDATSACGAELVFGTPDRPRDFLYFFVGYFIGGGLVLDAALYTGRTGNAAALGSITVPSASEEPRQLVDVASLSALEQALQAQGLADALNWDDPNSWSIPEAALDTWMNEAAAGIAHAAMTSVCVIDVECVVVDGWIPANVRSELVRRIRAQISKSCAKGIRQPKITEGTVGADARALGAASLPLSDRFLVNRNALLKGQSR